MNAPTAPLDPPAIRARDRAQSSLRTQITLVIALLTFVPNLALALASPARLTPIALLWVVVVALLCAGAGFVLSGTLLRPLSRLEQEVTRGAFAHPHADDPKEIRALRGAFTGLLERLSVEQARRSAFMATLVHDLKTPLIATGHLTRTLTTLPLPDAERREIGEHIQAETNRLLGLVQHMADAHRYERDELQLSLTSTDLRELLETVAARVRPRAEERGLRLHLHGQGHAQVDRAALERALTNLTENALRYAETQVQLRVVPQGLIVANDGPELGAPLETLTQPFNAQPALIAGQQYTAGTAGLGLFIVRRITEAHGGALTYRRSTLAEVAGPGAEPGPEAQMGPTTPLTLFLITLPEVHP